MLKKLRKLNPLKSKIVAILIIFAPMLVIVPIAFKETYSPISTQKSQEYGIKYQEINDCISGLDDLNSILEYNYHLISQSNNCLKNYQADLVDSKSYQNLLFLEKMLTKDLSEKEELDIKDSIVLNKENLWSELNDKFLFPTIIFQFIIIVGNSIIIFVGFWSAIFLFIAFVKYVSEHLNSLFQINLNR